YRLDVGVGLLGDLVGAETTTPLIEHGDDLRTAGRHGLAPAGRTTRSILAPGTSHRDHRATDQHCSNQSQSLHHDVPPVVGYQNATPRATSGPRSCRSSSFPLSKLLLNPTSR